MASTERTEPLWTPSTERAGASEMARFMEWAGARRGAPFASYEELWRWSVDELEDFWAAIWEFCDVSASRPYERVLAAREMPGARWFEGAELNYAENMLSGRDPDAVAVLHTSELRELGELTWGEL
jgi:acetoacetyl-CoA synthetase